MSTYTVGPVQIIRGQTSEYPQDRFGIEAITVNNHKIGFGERQLQ